MAWLRIESSVSRNRKFVKAGPGPSWLWVCGLAYCQEGLTDGFIPLEAIDFLGVKSARHLAKHLVAAGLWDAVEGGWQVHDYLKHNRPASDVRRLQDERRQAGANGGKASGESRRSKPEVFASPELKQPANPALSATALSETATAQTDRARLAPLHDTSHKKHAHCGRVCLHASLFGEFVRRRNHAGADEEIRAWAMTVEQAWAEKPEETGDPFDFWRARYAEQWPAATAPAKPKWGTWRPAEAR